MDLDTVGIKHLGVIRGIGDGIVQHCATRVSHNHACDTYGLVIQQATAFFAAFCCVNEVDALFNGCAVTIWSAAIGREPSR